MIIAFTYKYFSSLIQDSFLPFGGDNKKNEA